MKLHVVFKACDKVDSVHGLPRPFGMTKRQVIDVCVASLGTALGSLKETKLDYYVSVVGDAVSKDCMDNIIKVLEPTNVFNPEQPVGYREIMAKAGEFAANSPEDEWVYFIEDDYLHLPEAFAPRILDFFDLVYNRQKFALPCIMHPSDYPDQYTRLLSRCYMFQGPYGYWREVTGSTESYLCPVSYYKKKYPFFKECYLKDGVGGIGSDFNLSNLFRKEIFCFSPLPGIATHMHLGVMSNYVDWESVIKALNYAGNL